jgi:hypothetical protein
MEAGLVTLAKIVGTLLFAMGLIPWIFLLSPGDSSEPAEDETGAGNDHH